MIAGVLTPEKIWLTFISPKQPVMKLLPTVTALLQDRLLAEIETKKYEIQYWLDLSDKVKKKRIWQSITINKLPGSNGFHLGDTPTGPLTHIILAFRQK
jgi:hypothetical protein